MTDRDCKHGTLARQCDRCELEGEVERLRAFVAAFDEFHNDNGKSWHLFVAVLAARNALDDLK